MRGVLQAVLALLVVASAASTTCRQLNPFLPEMANSELFKVEVYNHPRFDLQNNYCQAEWNTYGTCCYQNDLFFASKLDKTMIDRVTSRLNHVIADLTKYLKRLVSRRNGRSRSRKLGRRPQLRPVVHTPAIHRPQPRPVVHSAIKPAQIIHSTGTAKRHVSPTKPEVRRGAVKTSIFNYRRDTISSRSQSSSRYPSGRYSRGRLYQYGYGATNANNSKFCSDTTSKIKQILMHRKSKDFSKHSTRCWNFMAEQRSKLLCGICSGRSNQFFANGKIILSTETCSQAADTCHDFFAKLDVLISDLEALQPLLQNNQDAYTKITSVLANLKHNAPPRELLDAFKTYAAARHDQVAAGVSLLSAEATTCVMIMNVRKMPFVALLDRGLTEHVKEEVSQAIFNEAITSRENLIISLQTRISDLIASMNGDDYQGGRGGVRGPVGGGGRGGVRGPVEGYRNKNQDRQDLINLKNEFVTALNRVLAESQAKLNNPRTTSRQAVEWKKTVDNC